MTAPSVITDARASTDSTNEPATAAMVSQPAYLDWGPMTGLSTPRMANDATGRASISQIDSFVNQVDLVLRCLELPEDLIGDVLAALGHQDAERDSFSPIEDVALGE